MLCLFSLVFLLVIPGICSQEWEAQYSSFKKCVLKGLTTILTCIYKHPDNLTAVTQIFWIINPVKDKNYINLLDHPDYRHRVQYSIKDRTSILTLSNVRREDEGIYCLIISSENLRYYGYPGINLTVTELRVEIPEEVVEKDSPVLICSTTCNLSDKTDFIWYKNGKPLSESSVRNRLFLRSVSSDDTGNYSCAARDQEHLPSPAVTLSVRYPPQSVSVSVSPSVIMSGDSVTLSCISDSNPPALNFSWFKENETSAVGSGQSFSSLQSGRFYCVAHNQHGHQRSDAVTVTVKGHSIIKYPTIVIAAGCAVLFLVCIIMFMRKRKCGGVSDIKQKQVQQPSSSHIIHYDDGLYARADQTAGKTQSADSEKIKYATIQHVRNNEAKNGNLRQHCPDPAVRSGAVKDNLVIYNTVK